MALKKTKALAFLAATILSSSANAASWTIDWSKSSKHLDDTEKGRSHYIEISTNDQNGSSKSTSYTELDGAKTLCTLLYEDNSGIFSGNEAKGIFINLSKIEKVESLGKRSSGKDTYFVDRYMLKDGTKIDSVQFDNTGRLYACEKNEKGEITGTPLKWKTFSIRNSSLCSFDEESAKLLTLDRLDLFKTFIGQSSTERIGIGAATKGFSQQIKTGGEAKASFDSCIEAEEKNNEYKRSHDKFVQSIIKDYVSENGDPISKVEAKWRTTLGMSADSNTDRDIALTMGFSETSFAKGGIEKYAKKRELSIAEHSLFNIGYNDACQNIYDYTGDLTHIGVDSQHLEKAIACVSDESGLVRFDVRLKGYFGVFEYLNHKYTLIEKSVNSGRTQAEVNDTYRRTKRQQLVVEPFVQFAIFAKGNMVIQFKAHDEFGEVVSFISKNYAIVTYMSKASFLQTKVNQAKYELHSAAESWYKRKSSK